MDALPLHELLVGEGENVHVLGQLHARKRTVGLEVGAEVLLHSGIKGKITKISDDSDMEIETTPGVKLTVVKQAVRNTVTAEEK